MTTTTFTELGLAEPLLRALNDAQYVNPTPIQAKSIPVLLEGRDLLGLAETGTGKTAAFVLPILQKLAAEGGRAHPGSPRALILAPTRELAIQIAESIAVYGRNLRLSHTVIYGGVGQRPQVNAIARGVDILVATPGRLLDLIEQRHLRLNQVQTFVLDEADRMLDMGFVRDVRRIVKMVPTKRHSLLFSATMPDDIAKLAAEFLTNPVRVEIARTGKTVDRIDQRVMFLSTAAKRDVLGRLLQDPEMKRVIVFTRTKRGADRVSEGDRDDRRRSPRDPRQQEPGPASVGARQLPQGFHARARRHRHRRARHRHRRYHARHQLRAAEHSGELRAPHRPHGARRRERHRHCALRA